MIKKNLSPVLIFSFNRKNKLKKLIISLKKNKYYKQSKIYVFQDYFNSEFDIRKKREINKTIEYLKELKKKEKNIFLKVRQKNFGLANNIISGVNEIIKKYNKAIILEDDLILSKNFLAFMNEALFFYEYEKKIWHISGWCFSIKSPKYKEDNYFLNWPCSWGWATWKNRWKYFSKNSNKFINWNKKNIKKFNFDNSYNFFSQIKRNHNKELNSWAIFWYAKIFEKKKLCIYPKNNLVENIGIGKNASNTYKKNDLFISKIKNKKIKYNFKFDKNLVENNYYKKLIKKKMKNNRKNKFLNLYNKIKTFLR